MWQLQIDARITKNGSLDGDESRGHRKDRDTYSEPGDTFEVPKGIKRCIPNDNGLTPEGIHLFHITLST